MPEHRNASPRARVSGCALALLLALAAALPEATGAANHTAARHPLVLRGAYRSKPVRPARLSKSLARLPKAKHVRPGGVSPARARAAQRLLPAAVEEFTQPNPNFNGIGTTNLTPPDPNGDVGPNHYIQMVNSQFQIFNKQGVSLAGPTNINQLWIAAGQNNACSQNNNGDPVVVYDGLADRWLMSQFAVPNGFTNPPTFECIAISQTANPVTGGWFLYQFQFTFGHDYPKIGVWPDGYYMSDQQGFFADTTTATSVRAVVFDRAQMLNGNAATFQTFSVPGRALIMLPSDLDGPAPPAGTPNFYARAVDGGLWGGADRVDLFAFSVNWTNAALSTFTTLPSVPTAASDQNLCGGLNLFDNCIPQPGTATLLESLTHWSMGHLQYRNFGTRETLVFDHTVDADGSDHAGIQWFELRRPPGGAWTMFQQGTHAPDAGNPGLADDPNRWMGSIAMDRLGDLALGYSISSNTVFPSIAYTGRQVGDPLGQMTQPETTLVSGTSSQTGSSRWGDYSAMTVDPVDDCRFWYTSEFIGAGGAWLTRIGSFRFSACDLPITATGLTFSAVKGVSFTGTVATFTDPDTNATAGEYTATIDWGDGSTTPGTVTGPVGGPFAVSGTHIYTQEGTYTVTITITDVDTPTNSATVTSTAIVGALTAGGSFVIGNQNAAVGAGVTFWGAQWSKLNTLSGGPAPAAFKGFSNDPSSNPACGQSWSTGAGNSSGPPAPPLPGFIVARVSSSISKSGSTISGDTPHLVVVHVNPGYDANPGHAGTGTVAGVLC